jgi:hypothetical protein
MNTPSIPVAVVRLGRIVATPNALEHLSQEDILTGIQRHQAGDWGDLSEDDKRENQLSLEKGFRLLSAYHAKNGTKFWIITEADRSATTVLLPEDY